jgi:hypothetical protein
VGEVLKALKVLQDLQDQVEVLKELKVLQDL